MSIKVMSWVWEHSRAEGTDRLVLLAIADTARDDGTDAWPAVATIAAKAKVSERTVQRSIKALCLLGDLSVEPNAGRRGTNLYTVRMSPRTAVTPDNETPVSVTPRQVDTVTPVTSRGDTRVTRTVLNRPSPQPPASGGRRRSHCPKHPRHNSKCGECVRLEERDQRQATWPPWCGGCNENTRKLDDELLTRCPNCHPMGVAS